MFEHHDGGTAYGLGQQVIDDSQKHGIEALYSLEHRWGAYLGRELWNTCKETIPRPMKLLAIFEEAGKKAEKEGRFLSWTVPHTNFPVVQYYVEGKVKKRYVQYGPKLRESSTGYFENTLQLQICFVEDTQLCKRKQAQGASPNAIHSLDAAHLTLTVNACEFPVTTIHDSFGCHLADMPKLYKTLRETFVLLYEDNPLWKLLEDIDGDATQVEIGSLNIKDVLDSEYCFS